MPTETAVPPGAPSSEPGAAPVQEPPRALLATLSKLGPGMIIAGSIVGSGELIATTKVGAQAGFWLLWLIVAGCVVKVFAQVEFGRHTVTWGETPLRALDAVPGPRARVNWLVWGWAVTTLLVVSQQGGIVGGVGQALAMSVPLTAQGETYNRVQDELTRARLDEALAARAGIGDTSAERTRVRALEARAAAVDEPVDAYLWATIVGVLTAGLLYAGRYGLIQTVSTVLVMSFTVVTLLTVLLLQRSPPWSVGAEELVQGLSLHLPPERAGTDSVTTALAAFGIIGLGAFELIMYPYWCLEKGYAAYTGLRGSPGWTERARGWMRVLRVDAWLSMVVYTFATVAFYLLGASVLWRLGLDPSGASMVRTLAVMYAPVFGAWAQPVFLLGAFAVLYSTFFVAAAGNARMVADGLGLLGAHDGSPPEQARWTRRISVLWPLVALGLFLWVRAPVAMVLASGIAQALLLPALGLAVLHFRYRRADERLRPGPLWDAMLWLSCLAFVVAAACAVWGVVR
jgi:Mn2+/Fe2+ NRAMP family transporter